MQSAHTRSCVKYPTMSFHYLLSPYSQALCAPRPVPSCGPMQVPLAVIVWGGLGGLARRI
jgi:hypothetical protein